MLKSTGVVRKVDELGRVVIPIELRRTLGIAIGDPVEFFVDSERIVLKKYAPGCVLCGSVEEVTEGPGNKLICTTCRNMIKAAG
jgi:AbrB family transcriptional regulator, transcriptional pleiotropic regulator of transition state genes